MVTSSKTGMFQQNKKSKYLVMGKRGGRAGEDLKPTFIVPWTKSKVRRSHFVHFVLTFTGPLPGDKASQKDVQVDGLRQPEENLSENNCGHLRSYRLCDWGTQAPEGLEETTETCSVNLEWYLVQ